MDLHTPLTHRCKNRKIKRITELKTNYSTCHLNSSKLIWFRNRLKKTFLRQHFCMVFIKMVTVQINQQHTIFRKCTLPWFVEKLKLISSFLSKAQGCNNIKLQDLRVLTFSMSTIPREALSDINLPVVAQIYHKKLISTTKWKDRNGFS